MPITSIIKGMTPAEYVSAMNNNYSLVKAGNITTLTVGMSGSQLISAINNNSGSSMASVGQKATPFTSAINSYFGLFDLSLTKPSSVSILWDDDFATITFSDETTGSATHELWESKDGDTWELSNIIAIGSESKEYYSFQNADYNFRIRARLNVLFK